MWWKIPLGNFAWELALGTSGLGNWAPEAEGTWGPALVETWPKLHVDTPTPWEARGTDGPWMGNPEGLLQVPCFEDIEKEPFYVHLAREENDAFEIGRGET